MQARVPKRMASGIGLDQYVPSAFQMCSARSAIALFLRSRLRDYPPELRDFVLREAAWVLEDVRDCRGSERVHHPPDHRGHDAVVRLPVLDGVEDLLLALPPHLH